MNKTGRRIGSDDLSSTKGLREPAVHGHVQGMFGLIDQNIVSGYGHKLRSHYDRSVIKNAIRHFYQQNQMGLVYEQTLNKASYLKCREKAFLENSLDTYRLCSKKTKMPFIIEII